MIIKRECRAVSRLLWDYAQRRLCESDADRIEIHIARCTKCRRELRGYQLTAGLVNVYKQAPEPEPTSTWHALRAQLDYIQRTEAVPPVKPAKRGTVLPVWVGSIAAGALLAAVWTAFQSAHPDSGELDLLAAKGGINAPILSEPEVKVSPVSQKMEQDSGEAAEEDSRIQAVGYRPVVPESQPDSRVRSVPIRRQDPDGLEGGLLRPHHIRNGEGPGHRPQDSTLQKDDPALNPPAETHSSPRREFVMGTIPTSGSRIAPDSGGGSDSAQEMPVW